MRDYEVVRIREDGSVRIMVCARAENDVRIYDVVNTFAADDRGLELALRYVADVVRRGNALEREV